MKVILISAGHTNQKGQDQGVVSGGFTEGVEAVKLRDRVATILRSAGRSVLEDGADGISDPLVKAIALARKVDLAVEIHFNAGPAAATGIEILAKDKDKPTAEALGKAVHDATGLVLRGESGFKSESSGQHHRLGFVEAGGLILEVCFLTNPSDMSTYVAKFEDIAQAIANVLAYVAR
jgi:N-acetylmuramoyl-L-alanine amidase